MTTAPVLKFPDFTKQFILHTDANDFAIGAVLSQEIDGKEFVIAFASKTLNAQQRKYDTSKKECLSLFHFCKQFRPYLFGQKFKLVTDHRALIWLNQNKDEHGCLARWSLQLQEFDFEIIHRAGKKHVNADSMTREPIADPSTGIFTMLDSE